MSLKARRLFARLLILALMLLPLIPARHALADVVEPDGAVCVVSQAGLDDVYFDDLQEAIASLPDNGPYETGTLVPDATITLLKDVDMGTSELTVDKRFTLELNGCVISFTRGQGAYPANPYGINLVTSPRVAPASQILSHGDLTIRDSSSAGSGTIRQVDEGRFYVINLNGDCPYPSLTLMSGTIDGDTCIQCGRSTGAITIIGGTINAASTAIGLNTGRLQIVEKPEIVSGGVGIHVEDASAEASITGGTIKAEGAAISYKGGKLTVGNASDDPSVTTLPTIYGNPSIKLAETTEGGFFDLNNGHFSDDAGNDDLINRRDNLMLRKYEALGDADYYLQPAQSVPGQNVCRNADTGVEYETLEAAHEALETSGQTIQLLTDVDLGATSLVTTKDFNLDLNGKTISGVGDQGAPVVVSFGILGICDESTSGTGLIIQNGKTGAAILTKERGIVNIAHAKIVGSDAGIEVVDGMVKTGYGKIKATGPDGAGVLVRDGEVTVDDDGVISSTGSDGVGIRLTGDGEVTIIGGIITGSGTSVENSGAADKFAIKGGSFSDDAGNGDEFTRPAGQTLQKGTSEQYYTLKDAADPGTFNCSCSLDLKDRIEIKFYMSNLSLSSDSYTIKYWTGLEQENAHTASLQPVPNDPGKYTVGAVGTFAAKEMTVPVYVHVYKQGIEEPVAKIDDYSVRTYCDNKIERSNDAKLRTLCQAVLDYGASAQKYFRYRTDDLANANHSEGFDERVNTVVVGDENQLECSEPISGLKGLSATLALESRTEINCYITPADGYAASDVAVKVDGVDVPVGTTPGSAHDVQYERDDSDSLVSVKILGINPTLLDHKFAIDITIGGETMTMKYSGLSYSYSKQDSNEENLAPVAKSLYNYWKTAKAAL